jgi:ABC-2 type transport system permease protein
MFSVLVKEFNAFFNSLAGYVVIFVFLTATGLYVWVFPQTNILDGGFANVDPLFGIAPYIFTFLIPAVCMRTFAEEKKAGTLELLLTRPLSDWQIILGKYFACLLVAGIALAPTLLYYYSVYHLGTPEGNIDSAAFAGSFIGLFCLAAVFSSIGIFASSLTDNQIVAFVLAVFLCFTLYDGFTSIASINAWADYAYVIGQLGIDYHYEMVSRGLLDSRNLLYFLSLSTLMLFSTKTVLESRKW